MACNKPLHGWYSTEGGFTMSGKKAYQQMLMKVPCGQCMGCRLAKTSEWATRIQEEAQEHTLSAFITLTYCDEKLHWVNDRYKENYYIAKLKYRGTKRERMVSSVGSDLNVKDLQNFIKRLRNYVYPDKIRYYAAGEYGDRYSRAHFHAIIFGYWPTDCEEIPQETKKEYKLYTSQKLEEIWKNGFVTIGQCTYESAAYTASYITKKINGDNARFHYYGRYPEFSIMSRRPGIGAEYYNNFKGEIWRNDTVISRGREVGAPRYYRNKMKEENPKEYEKMKLKRIVKQEEYERREITEEWLKRKQKVFEKDYINI